MFPCNCKIKLTSIANECEPVLQKKITRFYKSILFYEATDLADFHLQETDYRRRVQFGNIAHNSSHAYFDNFVKNTLCSNQSTFVFYCRSVLVNPGAYSGFTLCWHVNSLVKSFSHCSILFDNCHCCCCSFSSCLIML